LKNAKMRLTNNGNEGELGWIESCSFLIADGVRCFSSLLLWTRAAARFRRVFMHVSAT
jgi:hypothetical protein